METVTINLDHYNNLRDFKKDIEDKKTFMVYFDNFIGSGTKLITIDDAVIDIATANSNLMDENYKLRHPKKKETTINDVKKMNIFQFIKWKRKNK